MRALKILTCALLAAGVSTASAQAASAPPPVWQGDLFILTAATPCSGFTSMGALHRAVYRPHIAPPPRGQAAEALALNTQRSEFILEATGTGLRGIAKANGLDISSRAEVTTRPTTTPTTVALTILPATITARTPFVQISGKINNLFNEAGCTVTVVGVLGLRPAT
jgi:hypothetical protein